jgi:hypothetical protein
MMTSGFSKAVKQALLFVYKKKQKNFIYSAAGALATASPNSTAAANKSFFGSFCSQKELLSFGLSN